MGYSLCWVATERGDAQAIRAALGLHQTGIFQEVFESKIAGAELPSGWYLVLFHRKELSDGTLKSLSKVGAIVYCSVEDHVMFSRASSWKHEKLLWSVTHDCERGLRHLEVRGSAPASLEEIHAKLAAKQDAEQEADVDHIYDAPGELAKELTGFRHDQDMAGIKDKPYEVLEKKSEKKSFFGRFVGGKKRNVK